MVEVGDVKRDIAYHGDTLNVAARLEELCNETQQPILVSAAVKERLKLDQKYTTISIGHRKLSGREVPVEIFGLAPHN
jgi:adenylate cyclase